MATMGKVTKKNKKQLGKRKLKAREQAVLSVVSVRISDEEKERIDEIMRVGNIKRYSDVLRLAIQMIQVSDDDEQGHKRLFS
jgi:hypothetical protein